MIIGVDGNEANVEKKVGISEFAYQILLKFANIQDSISDTKYQIYLKNAPREEMPTQSENWKYRIVGPRKFWTQFGLPLDLYLHKPRPNVFFTPTHYAPRFSPVPTVVSVMDLSYLYFPELFRKNDLYQLKNWTRYSVKRASRVVTISESSKRDIIKEYGVESGRVVVVHPGVKMLNIKYPISNVKLKDKYGITEKYILFVGTLQPRKNIVRLIEAFSKLLTGSNNKNLQLVIVGKKGWLYEDILSAPQKFGIEDKVKFLDFVPDEDLPEFYKNAECFVLPSLYEGFGLPVLEAMRYGCPVALSNVSSLPEAGGDAAVYFDPLSVDDIASALQKIITDSDLRARLRKKGYEHIKKFSWEKAAKKVFEVLKEVAV